MNTEFNPKTEVAKEGITTPWFHFSIDDVFDSLIEITDKNIPLFEHPYFVMLKKMHDKYGISVGLHLFFEKEIDGKLRSLMDVRDLKKEIKDDGGWIYFAPHALNFETAPYNQSKDEQIKTFDLTYKEIDRFAGRDSYAKWIRLHYYSESYELADYFASKGVNALFSTDKPAGSHRMPQNIKDSLNNEGHATYEGMNFIRTHFRIENFANVNLDELGIKNLIKESFDKYGYIIIYAHEYEFERKEVCQAVETSFKVLNDLSIKSLKII